jgi:hypothetical protein
MSKQRLMSAPAATRRGLRSISAESSVEMKRAFCPAFVIRAASAAR